MTNILKKRFWSPYIVGAGIGLLLVSIVYFSNKYFGTSGSFARIVGVLESIFTGQEVKPFINWQLLFVVGIFLGGFVSSRLSGSRQRGIPSLWVKTFGQSKVLRYVVSFFGGALVLLGARIGGGCTSGHCISGGSQLALSSWLFLCVMFVSGITTAFVLYKK